MKRRTPWREAGFIGGKPGPGKGSAAPPDADPKRTMAWRREVFRQPAEKALKSLNVYILISLYKEK
jgi:hypothetical protein